jgi:RNA methyltransferase, TrmH family
METIASRKNPLVLLARRVADGDPEERGRMLLDGLHLVLEARTAGIAMQTVAFATRLLNAPDGEARRLATSLGHIGVRVVQVSDTVMDAMSPVSTPSGIVALAARPKYEFQFILSRQMAAGAQPILCIIDVQDPGNLGAIIRVAEAGGAAGIITCGATADPFGWKALRGSMGSALRMPIVREAESSDAVKRFKQAGVRVLATAPAGENSTAAGAFYDKPLTGACAILLGGEGPGLSSDLIAASNGVISIPMQPPVESLNVAAAAAVIIYEARRQRLRGYEHRLAVR